MRKIHNENILKNANNQAKTMNTVLFNLMNEFDFIGDIRGYGPMIGVEIVNDKKSKTPNKDTTQKIISKCKEKGLLLVSCGEFGNVIRFMGPLTTPTEQVEEALEIFSEALI